jgi:hypothetical protein
MALPDWMRGTFPRSCLYVLIFAAGLGAGVFLDYVRHTLGSMQYEARYAALAFIRAELVRSAKKEGRFPATIDAVIKQVGRTESVRADDLDYGVANMSYDESTGTTTLFVEKNPREYGFVRGRFVFDRDYWYFGLGF